MNCDVKTLRCASLRSALQRCLNLGGMLGVQSSALFLLIKTGFILGLWPRKNA